MSTRSGTNRWKGAVVYPASAVVATLILFRWNEDISAGLGASSLWAALLVILGMPLAALATRPRYVQPAQRAEQQRVIGLVWALRNRKFSFFVRTILLWIVLLLVVGAALVFLYSGGGAVAAATIANWIVVTSTIVFLAHITPSENLRLSPGQPAEIYILGPPQSGKMTFMALAERDKVSPEAATCQVHPTKEAADVTSAFYSSRKAATQSPNVARMRQMVSLRHPWSEFTGVRPTPVDLVKVAANVPSSPYDLKRRKCGFVIALPNEVDPPALRKELARIRAMVKTHSKVRKPIAVVVTKCDDQEARTKELVVDPAVKKMLDDLAPRRWRIFRTTDRAGNDSEQFTPAGQVSAIAWLMKRM
jgi:hypothetical protein